MKPSLTTLKTLLLALLLAVGVSYASAAYSPAPASPPTCTDLTIPGCNPPINVSTITQSKAGRLDVANTLSAINGIFTGKVGIGDVTPDGTLKLDVEGKVGATEYCDQNGANCIKAGTGTGGLQTRVSGTCAVGSSIRAIGADGAVTCEMDDAGGGGASTIILKKSAWANCGGAAVATCPAGYKVTGGGFDAVNSDGTGDGTLGCGSSVERLMESYPSSATSWTTMAFHRSGYAYAVCMQ